jgi:hypothetical protein
MCECGKVCVRCIHSFSLPLSHTHTCTFVYSATPHTLHTHTHTHTRTGRKSFIVEQEQTRLARKKAQKGVHLRVYLTNKLKADLLRSKAIQQHVDDMQVCVCACVCVGRVYAHRHWCSHIMYAFTHTHSLSLTHTHTYTHLHTYTHTHTHTLTHTRLHTQTNKQQQQHTQDAPRPDVYPVCPPTSTNRANTASQAVRLLSETDQALFCLRLVNLLHRQSLDSHASRKALRGPQSSAGTIQSGPPERRESTTQRKSGAG